MNLFRTAVRRPVATSMLFIAIVVFGVFSFQRLPVDLFPEIDAPVVSVVTTYSGAGALEIERNVTDPLESLLATVPQLDEMTSESVDDMSVITLEFDWDADMDEASNDVRDALGPAARVLPENADEPILQKFDAGAIPVVVYSATAEESYWDLEQIIDDELAGPLNRINGVADVSVTGAPQLQVDVTVDPDRLDDFHLDIDQISQALQAENITSPAGDIELGDDSYNLRVDTEFDQIEQIEEVIVANIEGRVVRVGDVAEVAEGLEDETAISRVNRQQGVTFMIQKQSDANTVQVASRVKDAMPALTETLPEDVEIHEIIDTSDFIVNSVDNLSSVLFYALLFVILVVLVFLRQWRATVIVAATIPVSLIVAFIYLALTGSSLNIISLSSLSIALGMVVDDAIVVLENVMRHVEDGSRPDEAAVYGTGEVGIAVFATTLTVTAVFLPLTFITGSMGVWFGQLGMIVVVTVVTSTLAALTLTPMMASLLLKRIDEGKPPPKLLQLISSGVEGSLSGLETSYGNALRGALRYKKTVLALAVVVFVGTVMTVPTIGTEFMPVSDDGQITVSGELETSRSLDYTAGVVDKIEEQIAGEIPELRILNSTSGSGGGGMMIGAGSANEFQIRLRLVDRDQRDRSVFDITDQVREILDERPEVVTYAADAGSGGGGGGGDAPPVAVHILGHDLDETTRLADELTAHIETIEGTRDVNSSRGDSRPEFEFVFDRDRLSHFDLTSASVASAVRGGIAGNTATEYRRDGDEFDVVVRYAKEARNSLSDIEQMSVLSPTGQRVRVQDLGEINEFEAPPNIERRDRDRVVTIEAGLHDRPLNEAIDEIQDWIDDQQLPPQQQIVVGGDFEEQQDTFAELFLILLLSVVLVYLVMAAQFESLKEPFAIMFSIPFAFTGVLLALLLTETPLSVMAFLGAIILVGIVVKNAIVLIDYIKLLRNREFTPVDAIIEGGIARLRPVLMTTATTVLAMFPLALNLGEGAEMWQPMAIAVIGGLLFSTLVTLVLVPLIYGLFDRKAVNEQLRREREEQ